MGNHCNDSSIRVAHINLNHARAANLQFGEDLISRSVDWASVNEPYTFEGKIVGIPQKFHSIYKIDKERPPRAALLIENQYQVTVLTLGRDLVSAEVKLGNEVIEVVSTYCPPSGDLPLHLRDLEAVLATNTTGNKLLLGDFNAKSRIWSPRDTDSRGEILEDFCNQHDLSIVNDPNSRPTYQSTLGESWVDLLLVKNIEVSRVSKWEILDLVTCSDHNLMMFELSSSRFDFPMVRKWHLGKLDWMDFQSRIFGLIEANQPDELNADDIGEFVERMEEEILKICENTRSKRRKARRFKHAVWWTEELSVYRSRTRALRRKYQKESDADSRVVKKLQFKKAYADYRRRLIQAKKNYFRSYLDQVVIQNAFGKPYRVAKDKLRKKEALGPIVKEDGTQTVGQLEAEREILRYHFGTIQDNFRQESVGEGIFEPISEMEVENIIQGMDKKKAPGPNGICLDVYSAIFFLAKSWFVGILNKCLSLGVFPKVWKAARVVLLHKDGKDRKLSDSYRPICLLPVWGKIFDKIITKRLVFFLETNNVLHERQYGFRRNRSTQEAIKAVLDTLRDNKRKNLLSCMITLDIKGAFNNARRADIARLLEKHKIPRQLTLVILSFLYGRTYMDALCQSFDYNKGVPQGSSLGPILWLLVVDEVLWTDRLENVYLQAYADDLVIIIGDSACYRFSEACKEPLRRISNWAEEFGLQINIHKCFYSVFPIRGRIGRRPTIKIGDQSIKFQSELKYLGLLFDKKLSWIPHLNTVLDKVSRFEFKLKSVVRATWGLRPSIVKEIYLRATLRLVLYGVVNWYDDTRRIKDKLSQIQRRSLIGLSKCYRTVATEALQILTGCVPADLVAAAEQKKYMLTHWRSHQFIGELEISDSDCVQSFRAIIDPSIERRVVWDDKPCSPQFQAFTDGSRLNGRTGCACLIFEETRLIFEGEFRLSDNATSFEAEAFAVLQAIQASEDLFLTSVHIFSDAKAVLVALTKSSSRNAIILEIKDRIHRSALELKFHWVKSHDGNVRNEQVDAAARRATLKENVDLVVKYSKKYISTLTKADMLKLWQERWSSSNLGRKTHSFFPDVNDKRLCSDFFVNQIYSGHGVWGPYQHRFFGRSSVCSCGQGEADEQHILFNCGKFDEIRREKFPHSFRSMALDDLLKDKGALEGIRCILADRVKELCEV